MSATTLRHDTPNSNTEHPADPTPDALQDELHQWLEETHQALQCCLTAILCGPPTVGSLIDHLHTLRGLRAQVGQLDTAIGKAMSTLEPRLLEALDTTGINHARGAHASATITQAELPNVEDWQAFHQFLIEEAMPELLQKRLSTGACSELKATGTPIPGLTWFTKRSISLKKL